MKVIQQMCVKSCEIKATNGDYFEAKQGKCYTTSEPKVENELITIFSSFWVKLPKVNFVLAE